MSTDGARPVGARELVDRLRSDYRANGSDWTRPGFRALAIQRVGAFRHGKPAWVRKPLGVVYRIGHRYARNRYGIEVHDTTVIGERFHIAHQHGIVIHEHATIGDDCMVRQGVTIGQLSGRGRREGAPTLGDRVQVGVGAVIVGPVHIGDDARIGPLALVMRDVPAGASVSGPPAKVFRAEQTTTSGPPASPEQP